KTLLAPGGRMATRTPICPAHSASARARAGPVPGALYRNGAPRRGGRKPRPAIRSRPACAPLGGRSFPASPCCRGPHKRSTAATMQLIVASVLALRPCPEQEIDALVDKSSAFADNRSTLVALPLMAQVLGAV